jgi:glycosyltransferase involved in cell wall biosynthesis
MDVVSRNHRVLFVDPGIHSKSYTMQVLRRERARLCPGNWFREERPNLWVYSPMLLSLYRFPPAVQRASWRIALQQIRAFCRQQGISKPVLWLYAPEAVEAVGKLDEQLVLYDCVDNYAATPYYASRPSRVARLIKLEERLLQCADIVTTTSKSLWEKKRQYNPQTFLIPNVADIKHFAQARQPDLSVPDDIAGLARPVIGFFGAVNSHKVDFGLVAHIATRHPDWQLVLIGPIGGWSDGKDISRLDLPNVHLLGARPYGSLPAYAKGFDVCIIPYRINEYTRDVFPLKFFEYLATGKPVVSTPLPSLLDYGHLVSIASDHESFTACVEEWLRDPQAGLQTRLAAAEDNTWEHRAAAIMELVGQRLMARESGLE